MDLYDVAREITDKVLGKGTYEKLNKNHPDPGVQRAIKRSRHAPRVCSCGAPLATQEDTCWQCGKEIN